MYKFDIHNEVLVYDHSKHIFICSDNIGQKGLM